MCSKQVFNNIKPYNIDIESIILHIILIFFVPQNIKISLNLMLDLYFKTSYYHK